MERLGQEIKLTPAISVSRLSHTYPAKNKRPARRALRDVSLEVAPGETFGLLGPNGGGKSTLFKILSTFFKPSPGLVQVLGLDAAHDAAQIRPRIGVVFQNPSLDAKLTVSENMTHQGHLYGLRGKLLLQRIASMLERYGLSDRRDEPTGTLSGGLRRRVELAKGLLHDPELILLDEPSTGLDPGARRDLWDHLRELKSSRRITLLLTTHLMEDAENCDRLLLINEGKTAASGSPRELKARIGGDVIAIESANPLELQKAIKERFDIEPALVDGSLRIERERGHAFIPQLVESFPGLIKSVNLSQPTLEDVFVHVTGLGVRL
ncbi:MAG: ABC transporter ATP-binding protein [Elusimicrobia bacterium RIFCSPHIGHO2_02_FULL_57_9]|nr:MAG: ABC transporter ATP-binding protein [Elusimicrobia bacterium RIFCSPHIGHO2_02_FULL_57_9]